MLDAVIVGSGVAGMMACALLAREGWNLLLLEQHKRLGGLMQTYRRRGLLFPTGVHAVGALAPGQILWRYWKYAGVLERLQLQAMDREGSFELRFGQDSFYVPWGRQAFEQRLLQAFPREASVVRSFCSTLAETVRHFALYNLQPGPEAPPTVAMEQPLAAFLRGLGASPGLRRLLAGIHPFYAVDPETCPLYVHCLVLDSFLQSAWRIDETRTPLMQAFAATLETGGVEIRKGARVARIVCPQGTVSAVELEGGERIAARTVIFSGHPRQLATLCQEPGGLRPAFKRRLTEAEDSPAFFGLGLAWPGDCPWARRDLFVYPDDATPGYPGGFPAEDPPLIYASAACTASKGRTAAVAMCPTPWKAWRGWQQTRTGRREAAYQEFKQQAAARLRRQLLRLHPGAAEAELLDIFTPLTYRDYTLTPRGSAYGLLKSTDNLRAGRLSPKTRIRGLYLVGQSVVLPGILGSTISSVAACGALLGQAELVARIRRETGD